MKDELEKKNKNLLNNMDQNLWDYQNQWCPDPSQLSLKENQSSYMIPETVLPQ